MTEQRSQEIGRVSFLPTHDGDGYSYGGAILVTFGDVSFNLGGFDAMHGYSKERTALAHLIAAAPALRDALQLLVDTYGFDPSIDSAIWQTAQGALAKAGGK